MSEEERNRLLEQGRAAYAQRAWADAYAALSAADAELPLAVDDVERLAWSAGLTGRDQLCLAGFERLYQLELEAAPLRAARWAFWCGYRLLSLGELGRGGGWLSRAQRLVEQAPDGCVVAGYLLLAEIRRHFVAGEFAEAQRAASQAMQIAERFHDRDLAALARNLLARVLLFQGQVEAGLALLDDALLSAASGELSATVSGLVYCTGLESCRAVCALDRAREWSQALSRWCEAQPQLITFSNACLAYRAEMLQLAGALQEAALETQRISERAAQPNRREGAGECFYQLGELQRLCGDEAAAEAAYQRATEFGRDPQPGLSLLRLAQGRTEQAASSMRRVLGAAKDALLRARYLPAYVDAMLASGDVSAARIAADELSQIAARFDSRGIAAVSAQVRGAVALEEGNAEQAADELTQAFDIFHDLGLLYPAARVRIALARACEALGDRDAAQQQRTAARQELGAMGARADLARLDPRAAPPSPAGERLTAREREVLRLLARGKTNKSIGQELHVSEKTVDRHVSNIFLKLGVATRAAATAFAYENALL